VHFFKERFFYENQRRSGFTVLELLIVIAIIGILATITVIGFSYVRQAAYFARTKQELRAFHQALEIYLIDHEGIYPEDTNRNIPPGIEPYLGTGEWPKGAFPDSVFDYDHWTDPETGKDIVQISVRFCDINGNNCRFPHQPWAENFDSHSSIYLCIEGACRSHISRPLDHPGYCVNCANNTP
jgi:general secretion pathway protein G